MRKPHFLFTTLASLTFATSAIAQTVPEVEPNTTKAEATPVVGISAGGQITGTSTGADITAGSTLINTVDTFRVKTGALPPGVYEHRLTLTSATVGHSGSIRSQGGHTGTACTTGGTVVAGDGVAQASLTTTTPPRYNLWYGFGAQEEIYYRVTGAAATTAQYGAVLSTTPITPTVIATAFDSNNPITISTVGQTAVDTEIVLYDAAGNLVGQNDNACPAAGAQSRLTRTLAPGIYYVAVTTFELQVDQPAPPDDSFFGVLIDFPGAVVFSSTSTLTADWDFEIRGCNGVVSVVNQAPTNSPFVVPWFQFTASAGAPAVGDTCASPRPLLIGTSTAALGAATNDGVASCDPGGGASKDVWYSFSHVNGGTLGVTTCATAAVDAVLTAFNACGGSEIACSDTCGGTPCGGVAACLTGLVLAPGQVVLIRLSDKGLTSGCTEVTLTTTFTPGPPLNDLCSAPQVLAGLGTHSVTNFGATTGPEGQAEALCNQVGGTAVRQDVWYTWTAPNGGPTQLTTCGLLAGGGGSQDTKIAVYSGVGCPTPGSIIACNDDDPAACGGFASKLTFNAVCGTTYTIQFGMYQGTASTYTGGLSITNSGPACATPSTSFCLGDGTGAPCPCSNNSITPGSGCATTGSPGGATLSSSGIASDETVSGPSGDTLVLTGTGLTGPALFFQADNAPGVINFGDGHLCASSNIQRMGVVFPSAGVASYPGGSTPIEIHFFGNDAGETKFYQCWYRSSPALCQPGVSNFSLTQGLSLVWGN